MTFSPVNSPANITLPVSLFKQNSRNDPVTVFFAFYASDNLFPSPPSWHGLQISTPVIGATVLDEIQFESTSDYVTVFFQLKNRVSVLVVLM